MQKIAVVGLGYVGLPLALLADTKGFDVVGVEVNKDKLVALRARKPIIDDDTANKQLQTSQVKFTEDYAEIRDADIVIICVPTPVHKDKKPDLSLVTNASLSAAEQMKDGSLLIVESTINPGVCDEVIIPAIESKTKHKIGNTLLIAHCPERINPGDPKWHVGNINRVVGGNNSKALDTAYQFYSKLVDAQITKMGNLMEAEAVKVVENSFRDINIAFVNELAMSFTKLGINVVNVINGAATKPFSFMAHYPSIGVGGHCIPVDPYYLIEYARHRGFDHKFMALARNINEGMPNFVVELLEKGLREAGLSIKDANVCVLGLSYKPNVGDDRESPSYKVIELLNSKSVNVTIFDPYFPGKSTAKNLNTALQNQDAIILATNHREFLDIKPSSINARVFIDGKNCFKPRDFEQTSTIYFGVGVSS